MHWLAFAVDVLRTIGIAACVFSVLVAAAAVYIGWARSRYTRYTRDTGYTRHTRHRPYTAR